MAVGGRRLAKLARLPHDLVILGVRVLVAGALALAGRVGGGAKVLEASLAGKGVEALGGLVVALAGKGGRQGGQEEQRGSQMHLDESLGSVRDNCLTRSSTTRTRGSYLSTCHSRSWLTARFPNLHPREACLGDECDAAVARAGADLAGCNPAPHDWIPKPRCVLPALPNGGRRARPGRAGDRVPGVAPGGWFHCWLGREPMLLHSAGLLRGASPSSPDGFH